MCRSRANKARVEKAVDASKDLPSFRVVPEDQNGLEDGRAQHDDREASPIIKPCRHNTRDSLSRNAMTFLRKGAPRQVLYYSNTAQDFVHDFDRACRHA